MLPYWRLCLRAFVAFVDKSIYLSATDTQPSMLQTGSEPPPYIMAWWAWCGKLHRRPPMAI